MPAWPVAFDLRVDLSSPDLVQLVARAEALASVIRGVPIPPHVRRRLDGLNILRAVRGTTGIEGSDLSEEEVSKVLASDQIDSVLPHSRAREEQEVRNANTVMLFIADTLRHDRDTPITEPLVATIHRLTTENIAYENNTPGSYRSHGVSVGSYVPPRDRPLIRELMAAFIRWLNEGVVASWPAAVRAVAAHFYFISIHPFGDGNGRTARALESFLLYQGRINALGFYSLSNFYYRRREEYVALLDYTRFKFGKDLTPFICFALNGLVDELEAVHSEVLEEITWIAFNDFIREQLALSGRIRTKAGDRLFGLVTHLREPTAIRDLRSGASIASHLYAGLSAKTLSRDLEYLRSEGFVVIADGNVRANLALMRESMP